MRSAGMPTSAPTKGCEYHGERRRQREGYAVAEKDRVAVGTESEERRVPKTDQSGIADQQHETYTGDGPDEDEHQFADVEGIQEPGGRDHGHRQQRVPEPLAIVAKEIDILAVTGV